MFKTANKFDYNRHLLTRKHKEGIIGNVLEQDKNVTLVCACKKVFATQSGMWKHRKKCNTLLNKTQVTTPDSINDFIILKNLCRDVILQNKELKDDKPD